VLPLSGDQPLDVELRSTRGVESRRSRDRGTPGEFGRFAISGALAFLIDAGLTQAWVELAGLHPWSARALAFPAAVTFTWLFNRRYTFRVTHTDSLPREWLRYVGTQLAGLGVNLTVYAVLVSVSAHASRWPAAAVAAGSVAGMVVNYVGARRFAFRR
jgi:putative flippase GtrA